MSDETGPSEVEFIPAQQDAELRLACFQSIRGDLVFNEQVEAAKILYAWIMGDYDEEQAEPGSITPEEICERKH